MTVDADHEGILFSMSDSREAAFVVVGGAITRLDAITRRFIEEAATTRSLRLAECSSR